MDWMKLIIDLTLMPLVAFVVGLFMILVMRRIGARLQRRIGPPILQPLYDILKLYGKETQISHGLVHELGVVVAVGGYIAATTLVPVPGMNGIADKGGLIVLLYFMMVPTLGLALGVGQCANPNGSIGVSRALTAMLAYDIPFVIVVVGVAYHYGATNLIEVVQIQQEGGIASWGIVQMPLLAIAGLIALVAMLGKQPFENYVAPAEIATGPMVEMGGKFLGALFVTNCLSVYLAAALYTVIFLGGGENWLTFLAKAFIVGAIPMTISFIFPRYRTEDLVAIMWKWPAMIGLLGLAFVYV